MKQTRLENEGAAMLVVMLILLMSTATAVFAIHSTATEVRAAGHTRTRMQTHYVAETGLVAATSFVDSMGPRRVLTAMRRSTASGAPLELEPFEPGLVTGEEGYRLYSADLNGSLTPITDGEANGRSSGDAFIMVDVYEAFNDTPVVTGHDLSRPRFQYMNATYTARGRIRIEGEVPVAGEIRPFNETASDARLYGVSGPF